MKQSISKTLQFILLGVGIVALVVLLIDIAISVAATTHNNTPERVVKTKAGPYELEVQFYKSPANAGYAMPFAVKPTDTSVRDLTFEITSVPINTQPATPVKATLSPDSATHGVQGNAEITVQGDWQLQIIVAGPQGKGEVDVPLTAVAPPAIPDWTGWIIGLIPLAVLLVFVLLNRQQKVAVKPVAAPVETGSPA